MTERIPLLDEDVQAWLSTLDPESRSEVGQLLFFGGADDELPNDGDALAWTETWLGDDTSLMGEDDSEPYRETPAQMEAACLKDDLNLLLWRLSCRGIEEEE